jgi:hypothetical protein
MMLTLHVIAGSMMLTLHVMAGSMMLTLHVMAGSMMLTLFQFAIKLTQSILVQFIAVTVGFLLIICNNAAGNVALCFTDMHHTLQQTYSLH